MAASNLTLRLGTAAVMIPLLLALLYLGPAWGWLLFLLAVGAVGGFELFGMTHPGDRLSLGAGIALVWGVTLALWFGADRPKLLLTALLALPIVALLLTLWRLGEMPSAALRMAVTAFGPLWIGGGIGAIALVRTHEQGASFVVLSLVLAWVGDTGAYFAGRKFGKRKLYEQVSPKKTVEGAIGGVLTTVAGAVVMRFLLLRTMPLAHAALLGVAGAVLGICGDLGESLIKRSVGVKDSGGIFPGHGGMLDRIDAVMLTAPLTLLYLLWRP